MSTPVGPSSCKVTCPSCHATISTSVESEATSKTHLVALCLCVLKQDPLLSSHTFCCWLCCCLPYCMDSCRAQNHYCPNCKAFIGTYAH